MDASNGPPADGKFVAAPTVAPPPGARPMAQSVFPQTAGAPLGLQGMVGLRPSQLNPAAAAAAAAAAVAAGLPLFQAQTGQAQPLSGLGRRASVERAKGVSQASVGRKQCNCKNSRCLKLYCECFASGRYCSDCNCLQCCNNRENESTRQGAVEAILERNPNAFRPKIQAQEQVAAAAPTAVSSSNAPGRHLKGCNCKKSSCLKKYCECFQAGIYCSENCKCVDCKNFEDSGGAFLGIANQATGGGGAGSKRVRYSSAPPAPTPASGPGLAAGSLAAIRPGMLPPGLTALLQQQQQQAVGFGGGIGLGLGLPGLQAGLQAGVVPPLAGPSAGATGGGSRPGAAAGSMPGGAAGAMGAGALQSLQSLPQALSMALAAAVSAGVGVPGNPAGGQQLLPLLPSPSPPPLGQGPQHQQQLGLSGQLPSLTTVRSSLYEVVNGMVKRNVIEELCRLLWLVADDEGMPTKPTTTTAACSSAGSGGVGPSAASGAPGEIAVADGHGAASQRSSNGPSQQGQQPEPGPLLELDGLRALVVPKGVSGVPAGRPVGGEGEEAGVADAGTAAASGGKAGLTGTGGERGGGVCDALRLDPGGGLQSTAVPMEMDSGPATLQANGRAVTESRFGGGEAEGHGAVGRRGEEAEQMPGGVLEALGAPSEPQPLPQAPAQSRRPGPLYGRKERVVLEEFLSILNKIGDTAAKKLSQQQAQQQQQAHQQQHLQLQLQAPLVMQPPLVSAPAAGQQALGQQLLPVGMAGPGTVTAPAPPLPSSGLPPQGSGQAVVFSAPPQAGGVGLPVCPTAAALGPTAPGLSQAPSHPSQSQPALTGAAGIPAAAAAATAADGVPIPVIRPPLPSSGLVTGGTGAPHSLMQAISGMQQLPAPNSQPQQPHLQGGVPVILAPPRGGAAHAGSLSGGHPHAQPSADLLMPQPQLPTQPQEPQVPGLQPPMFGDQQSQAAALCATPFLPYSAASLHAPSDSAFAEGSMPHPLQNQSAPVLHPHPQQFLLQQSQLSSQPLPGLVGIAAGADVSLPPAFPEQQQQHAAAGDQG